MAEKLGGVPILFGNLAGVESFYFLEKLVIATG